MYENLVVHSYQASDCFGIRAIFGDDEFARPTLNQRFPRYADYLADSLSHYIEYEPESTFVALVNEQVVGVLLGAVDTERVNDVYEPLTQKLLRTRIIKGMYDWPSWLWSYFLTEWAGRKTHYPEIDITSYPAHLHIGLLPGWRRKGIGTVLMQAFESYLRQREIPGYHLYVSSFNVLGLSFYKKNGLQLLGQFDWRFHDGEGWRIVTETIFGRRL
jgi:GNAT superfamily N-acetyltransferase